MCHPGQRLAENVDPRIGLGERSENAEKEGAAATFQVGAKKLEGSLARAPRTRPNRETHA